MNKHKLMSFAGIASGAAALCVNAGAAMAITLTPFASTFLTPIGIDWYEPLGQLIMSVNYPTGIPNNLDLVAIGGAHTNYSTLSGLTNEVKVATVRASSCQAGFAVGDAFTGNGQPGQIVKIASGGGTVTNPWVTLSNETLVRGSLFQDRFCAAGGDLVVVTGDEQEVGVPSTFNTGNVWRVTSAGAATKVATIGTHLEGVTTIANVPASYGPLAGRIIAGAEEFDQTLGPPHYAINGGKIYAVDPNAVDSWFTISAGLAQTCTLDGSGHATPNHCNFQTPSNAEFHPEDLDVIRGNAQFFGVAFSDGEVLSAPASDFTNLCGQVLITQEFPFQGTSGLSVLSWNAQTTSFNVAPLPANLAVQQWEHVTFTSGQDCTPPPPSNLQTVTQGGWGAPAKGKNPGTVLNAYFTAHPGTTVKIGDVNSVCGGKTLSFSSANAIRSFLPAGGTPGALPNAGVFAGQVLALQLNITVLPTGPALSNYVLTTTAGVGKTVGQVLADADAALGGCGLPSYVTSISQLNDIVDYINNLFD
jgi:hypothetical protein